MDITFTREHKGAEIIIVVEDDIITTSKIYNKNGECVEVNDITDENGNDVVFSAKNYYAVLDMAKANVDTKYAVEVATAER